MAVSRLLSWDFALLNIGREGGLASSRPAPYWEPLLMKQVFSRRSVVAGLTAAAAAAIAPSPIYARHLTGRPVAKQWLLPDIPGLPATNPERVGIVADVSARIGTFMRRYIDSGHLCGGVTALARRGKLIHFAAHGMLDVEVGTTVKTDGI